MTTTDERNRPTDRDAEAAFASLAGQAADLETRSRKFSKGGNLGCALMVLPVVAALWLLVQLQKPGFADLDWFGWPMVAFFVGVVAVMFVGFRMWRPWATHNAALHEETDEALTRPMVEALLPGTTFDRPPFTLSSWHPSLLLAQVIGLYMTANGRMTGRPVSGSLAGCPLTVHFVNGRVDHDLPTIWLVEIELPFFVDGHLRLHTRNALTAGKFWSSGFETLAEATERLGKPFTVELAPLGTGTGSGPIATPDGFLPAEALLSTGLLDAVRSAGDVAVAVTSNRLWVVMPRSIGAFESHVGRPADLAEWTKAAAGMRVLSSVVGEVVAAGGG